MSRENYDNYDQEDLTYHAADHSADDAINSETMEKKDPAINQHEDDSNRSDDEESKFSPNNTNENNDNDSDFDNDANRRTLDESKAVEDDDEEE